MLGIMTLTNTISFTYPLTLAPVTAAPRLAVRLLLAFRSLLAFRLLLASLSLPMLLVTSILSLLVTLLIALLVLLVMSLLVPLLVSLQRGCCGVKMARAFKEAL